MLINSKITLSDSTVAELDKLEKLLEKELSGGNTFISEEALRILRSGGKRLRPLITILFAGSCGSYNSDFTLKAAAAIETMHMATLVHDDTIDNAEQRRGIDTTFKKHGIHTAVYTGDWMLLKSLKILSSGDNDTDDLKLTDLLNMLSDGLEMVCDGEIDQYYGRGIIPGKKDYYRRIKGKTAAMFGAAAVIGARVSGIKGSLLDLCYDFGLNFGTAFQIRDDIIDMGNTGIVAGKPVENDLREGIITLPMLLVCEKSRTFRAKVEQFLMSPADQSATEIIHEAIDKGGIQMADKECSSYISRCFSILEKLACRGAVVDEIRELVSSVFILE